MYKISNLLTISVAVYLLTIPAGGRPAKARKLTKETAEITGKGPALFWHFPQDIAARDLYYGPGGRKDAPHSTAYTFLKEDMGGTNPKFDVTDGDGVRWKVKLGEEARPETVASRLVWAVGYHANEDYFVPQMQVKDMPLLERKRGRKMVQPGGIVYDVRLKRYLEDEKKIGTWKWDEDPFTGSREWNGLRVLMAVINNWDLKDENNAIYQVKRPNPEQLYLISDLGSSFGTIGLGWSLRSSKGNLKSYSHSKFIRRITSEFVDFYCPARPALPQLARIHEAELRFHLRWIGRGIPRQDARWMGDLLGRLSPKQIRDAFRSAGYKPDQVEGFSAALEKRIALLRTL